MVGTQHTLKKLIYEKAKDTAIHKKNTNTLKLVNQVTQSTGNQILKNFSD